MEVDDAILAMRTGVLTAALRKKGALVKNGEVEGMVSSGATDADVIEALRPRPIWRRVGTWLGLTGFRSAG